ncbi:Alkyl hydroperoxide reductase C [Buchnera aphidicola (Thelaxes suberi)]|uniref:peroxiredoxin C n=1 Tax=Buchnera aphidicola TaxID=9 RepID=UPI003464D48F
MNLVTLPAPDFTASAVLSNGEFVEDFNLKKYINNKIAVLFFWPMDFTFVCPSELIEFNNLYPEFKKRKVELIGISIDSIFVHNAWRNTPIKQGGVGKLKYIMVSDIKKEIQRSYDIEHPHIGVALRASFLIDKNGIIRHQTVNDLPFGRNISEIIRMIDALQFHEKNGEVCPVNWKKGNKGMHPSPEGVIKYFNEK